MNPILHKLTAEADKEILGITFGNIYNMVLSADGKTLAFQRPTSGIEAWDLITRRPLPVSLESRIDTAEIEHLALSNDGQILAASGYVSRRYRDSEQIIEVWNVPADKKLQMISGSQEEITALVLNADGRIMVSGCKDGTIRVWDTISGKERFALDQQQTIIGVALSADGQTLVGATADKFIHVWKLLTDEQMPVLVLTIECAVESMALSADGNFLATINDEWEPQVWDLHTGENILSAPIDTDVFMIEGTIGVLLSANGKTLVQIEVEKEDYDTRITIWDVSSEDEKPLHEFSCQARDVSGVALSADGRTLVSANAGEFITIGNNTDAILGGTFTVWELPTGDEVFTSGGHENVVSGVVLSPDGNTLISASWDGTIKLWDFTDENFHEPYLLNVDHPTYTTVNSLALSTDGKILASGGNSGTVEIWDIASRSKLHELYHGGVLTCVVLSPDGHTLVSASMNQTIKVWDLASKREIYTLHGHSGDIDSLVFSADGHTLVSGSEDESIKIWDLLAGQERQTLSGSLDKIVSLALSPDNRSLASGSSDGTIRIWDFLTGEVLYTLAADFVAGLTYTADGLTLLAGTGRMLPGINAWSVDRGYEEQHTGFFDGMNEHESVTCFALSPNDRALAVGYRDRTITVWKLRDMGPLDNTIPSTSIQDLAQGTHIGHQNRRVQDHEQEQAMFVVQAWASTLDEGQREMVRQICDLAGPLPLALHIAGRYLSKHQTDIAEYLAWLQQASLEALDQRKRREESVLVLLTHTVERLTKDDPDAQEVLTALGLLAATPFTGKLLAAILGWPGPRTRSALNTLHDYGLLSDLGAQRYEVSHTLIHTYAREVLLPTLTPEQRETSTKNLLTALAKFSAEKISTDAKVRENFFVLLPHIMASQTLPQIEQGQSSAPVLLFYQAADALSGLARYDEAESLFLRALAISGQWSRLTDTILKSLAELYCSQGRLEEAEPLYQRALAICEEQSGPHHLSTTVILKSLAELYCSQGRLEEAEPLYQRVLTIYEERLEPDHPSIATILNNLAEIYRSQGKFEEAEPLYQRALTIYEERFEPDHPSIATILNNLALIYLHQVKFGKAEPLFLRALAIHEQQLGPHHPKTATILNNLANLYDYQGEHEKAEPLYQRALVISEEQLGPDHPQTASSLNNLALFYLGRRKYEEAEPLFLRALAICEQQLGPHHPKTQAVAKSYAAFLKKKAWATPSSHNSTSS